jgi:hypothetical protein
MSAADSLWNIAVLFRINVAIHLKRLRLHLAATNRISYTTQFLRCKDINKAVKWAAQPLDISDCLSFIAKPTEFCAQVIQPNRSGSKPIQLMNASQRYTLIQSAKLEVRPDTGDGGITCVQN